MSIGDIRAARSLSRRRGTKRGPFGVPQSTVDNGALQAYAQVAWTLLQEKRSIFELKCALKNADESFLATETQVARVRVIAWRTCSKPAPAQGAAVHRMVFTRTTLLSDPALRPRPGDLDQAQPVHAQGRAASSSHRAHTPTERAPAPWRKARGAVRRPCAVGRDATGGRARAGADGVSAPPPDWDVVRVPSPRLRDRGGGQERGKAAQDFGAAVSTGRTRVATGRDFSDVGVLQARDVSTSSSAPPLAGAPQARFNAALRKKPVPRAAHPSLTSTLQQEAGRKLAVLVAPGDAGGPETRREAWPHTHVDRLGDGCLEQAVAEPARRQAADRTGPEFVPTSLGCMSARRRMPGG